MKDIKIRISAIYKHQKYSNIMKLMPFLLLLLIPLSSATIETLGTFKQNTCINLIQTCSNCTYNNITTINLPDGNYLSINSLMTKSGTNYNYTFCNTSQLGSYVVNGIDDINGNTDVWAYDLKVTPTGDKNNLGFYIMLSVLILGVLVIGIFTHNIPLTLIGGMITMAWGVYIGFNGFDVFKNSATEVLSIGVIAFGAVWIGIAGLEYFEII